MKEKRPTSWPYNYQAFPYTYKCDEGEGYVHLLHQVVGKVEVINSSGDNEILPGKSVYQCVSEIFHSETIIQTF